MSPQLKLSREERKKLRQQLVDHFNEAELRDLCFELGVKHEELEGETVNEMARELITYCERRNQLSQLIETCKQHRPNIIWVKSIPSNPLPEEARSGLRLLAELMKDPEVKDAVSDYQNDFRMSKVGIETIRHFKHQHDLFQEIEASYNIILHSDRPRLPEEKEAWSSLVTNQLLLKGPMHELLKTAEEPTYAARAGYWLPMLERGQTAMQRAVEEKDLRELDTALRFLYRALDRGLPRVNGHLVDAVIDLPLDRLIEAIDVIHKRIGAGLAPDTSRRIVSSVEALVQLNEELKSSVDHHNDWQFLDDELRRVDALMDDDDVSELELTWPDLKSMAEDLYGSSREHWARDLQRSGDRLDKALTAVSSPSPATVNGIFKAYRLQVSRRFRAVDDQLLRLCEDLRKLGEPLDWLLRTI